MQFHIAKTWGSCTVSLAGYHYGRCVGAEHDTAAGSALFACSLPIWICILYITPYFAAFLQYHAYFQPIVINYWIWRQVFHYPLPTVCSMKRTVVIRCCKVWSGNQYISISNCQPQYVVLEHSQIPNNTITVLSQSLTGRQVLSFWKYVPRIRQHCFQPIATKAYSALPTGRDPWFPAKWKPSYSPSWYRFQYHNPLIMLNMRPSPSKLKGRGNGWWKVRFNPSRICRSTTLRQSTWCAKWNGKWWWLIVRIVQSISGFSWISRCGCKRCGCMDWKSNSSCTIPDPVNCRTCTERSWWSRLGLSWTMLISTKGTSRKCRCWWPWIGSMSTRKYASRMKLGVFGLE